MTIILLIVLPPVLLGLWTLWLVRHAPEGYEDEKGFHYGAAPVDGRAQRELTTALRPAASRGGRRTAPDLSPPPERRLRTSLAGVPPSPPGIKDHPESTSHS